MTSEFWKLGIVTGWFSTLSISWKEAKRIQIQSHHQHPKDVGDAGCSPCIRRWTLAICLMCTLRGFPDLGNPLHFLA